MIHDYKAARSICGFVEFCAWAAVVVAALVALMAIGAASSSRGGAFALTGLIPAFTFALAGFIVIVMVQMARATMDGSVAAQKSLIENQKQHDEMMQTLRTFEGRAVTASQRQDGYSERVGGKGPSILMPETQATAEEKTITESGDPSRIAYRGHVIEFDGAQYQVGKFSFSALAKAKLYISDLVDQLPDTHHSLSSAEPPKGLG